MMMKHICGHAVHKSFDTKSRNVNFCSYNVKKNCHENNRHKITEKVKSDRLKIAEMVSDKICENNVDRNVIIWSTDVKSRVK